MDCGVLLEAPEGEIVAVKFDEFDVGSIDRVDLLVSVQSPSRHQSICQCRTAATSMDYIDEKSSLAHTTA